jgi:hypothetical protein
MPKKHGTNQKAEAARARKEEVKTKQREEGERKREDSKWVDDDKQAAAKEKRRLEQEAKKIEMLQRKAENKKLADQEMEAIAKTTKGPRVKMTQAQIQASQQTSLLASLKAKAEAERPAEDPEEDLEECKNPNYSAVRVVEAHTLDEALTATEAVEELDRHPEKRRRRAFDDYVEEKLPEYRAAYPSMKRKQLVNMLFKEFKTSEENPMNKPSLAFNELPRDHY